MDISGVSRKKKQMVTICPERSLMGDCWFQVGFLLVLQRRTHEGEGSQSRVRCGRHRQRAGPQMVRCWSWSQVQVWGYGWEGQSTIWAGKEKELWRAFLKSLLTFGFFLCVFFLKEMTEYKKKSKGIQQVPVQPPPEEDDDDDDEGDDDENE